MATIKEIRNWTAEDRNEIRLLVRKLNGVIDSLNYKYWRFKHIAYMDRRLTYLTDLKKQHQENINNLRKRGERIYLDIQRLKTEYNKPITTTKSYLNFYKKFGFFPTSLPMSHKQNRQQKLLARDIETLTREIGYINEKINQEREYIKGIDSQIKTDCANIEHERTKRNAIKDAYKKQLLEEYNNLVTRLNNLAGYQGNPIIRIEPPSTFYDLPRAQYWMFHVTEEMETVNENE